MNHSSGEVKIICAMRVSKTEKNKNETTKEFQQRIKIRNKIEKKKFEKE